MVNYLAPRNHSLIRILFLLLTTGMLQAQEEQIRPAWAFQTPEPENILDVVKQKMEQNRLKAQGAKQSFAACSSTDVFLYTQDDVEAFGALRCIKVTGSLYIDDSESAQKITDLSLLSTLTAVGGGLVVSTSGVTNVDAFSGLTHLGQFLILQNNHSLLNLDGFSNLTSIGGSLFIVGNPVLQHIDGLSDITSIGGTLWLSSNHLLTNLDAFSNLTSIPERLFVSNHASLQDLKGLSNISFVGWDLWIIRDPLIPNLDALSNLSQVKGSLAIGNNAALQNIDGLSNLSSSSVGGSLIIINNPLITNIDAFSNLTSVRDMTIEDNAALQDLEGLSSLTEMYGITGCGCFFSTINDNASLRNLDGLRKLERVGVHFEIAGNPVLESIDGLSNVSYVRGDLRVLNNPSLSSCCGIYKLLCADSPACTTDAVGGIIETRGNGSGCAETDIIMGCSTGPAGALPELALVKNLPRNFRVYPNPVRDEVIIDLEQFTAGSVQLSITDTLGKTLWEKAITGAGGTARLTLNLHKIPSMTPGLYFVTVMRAGVNYSRRIIVQAP